MAIKFIEYTHKFHEHLYPGKFFGHESTVENLALYFSLYFSMTGLHGVHVLIGMGLSHGFLIRTLKGEFHSELLHACRRRCTFLAFSRFSLDLLIPFTVFSLINLEFILRSFMEHV